MSLSKGVRVAALLMVLSSTRHKKEALSLPSHNIAPEAELKFEKMGPGSLTVQIAKVIPVNFLNFSLWPKEFEAFSMC